MLRILIKLGLALFLVLGLVIGWLYWKYQDQVKMATKGAGELVDLKQKVESAEAQLVEIRSKLKQQVEEALKATKGSLRSFKQEMPHEVFLIDLHRALKSLNGLTGETTIEDILGNIFSTFCIGK